MKLVCAALLLGACADPAPARAPQILASEAASGLAVGGGYAYYTSGNAVKRVPLEGGDALTIADGQLVTSALAISEKYVFWANGQVQGQARVLRAPLGGGTIEVLASGLHFPGAIVVDATDVYFIESCCSNQGLWRVAKDGAPMPVRIADIPARTFAFGLAVDRTSVYWTQDAFGMGDGQIMRQGKQSGATEVFVASQPGVGAVAVDAWNVYWYVAQSNGGPSRAIRRRALAGGDVVDLAADEAEALGADGTFVWWGSVELTDGGHLAALRRMGAAGTDAATWAGGKQIAHIAFDRTHVVWADVDEPAIFVMNR
jgi:hypothetical protein